MESLHELELTILVAIQALGDWLESPLQSASLLGNEEFFLLVMPTLYWCLDATLGLRLAVMLILSNGLNAVVKLVFHQPRPYWIDARVLPLSEETSFGLPSGHAMNAASLWGMVIASLRRSWATVIGLVVIFLIGFSRLYLGMHFISDVLAGWLLGGLLLLAFLRLEAPLVKWLRQYNLRGHLLLAFGTAILLALIILLSRSAMSAWQLPTTWSDNAVAQHPDGNPIDPLNVEGAFTLAGTWFGMLSGVAWYDHRRGGYSAGGTAAQRMLRYPVGVIGLMIFWFGLGQIFPDNGDVLSFALRFARYAMVGLWVSALAPLLFERLGLARRNPEQVASFSTNQNPL